MRPSHSEVTAGRIQIEQLRDGIRLNLPQHILFPSGSATLQAAIRRGDEALDPADWFGS